MFGGITNTKDTPIEALELAFSPRVLPYRLRRGAVAPDGEIRVLVRLVNETWPRSPKVVEEPAVQPSPCR